MLIFYYDELKRILARNRVWFQKIFIPATPKMITRNSEGSEGISAIFFMAKYKFKLEIPRGVGVQTKTTILGRIK